MSTHTFDQITPSLSSAAPRRRVIRGLGGLALGALGITAWQTNVEAASCKSGCLLACRKKRKCFEKCVRQC